MNARIPDDALPPTLDPKALQAFVDDKWDNEIIPALTDYIAVPAKSPAFDADWEKNAFIERVVRDAAQWVEAQKVSGLTLEVVRLPGRTPVIFFDAPATRSDNGDTILLYGHGQAAGILRLARRPGPLDPKLEDGKLYGRGGADDGYAVYASLTAIMALDKQGVPRPRCVGIVETCEESGSYDLLPYVDALRSRLGNVALVVCGLGRRQLRPALDDHLVARHGLGHAGSAGAGRGRALGRLQRRGAVVVPHPAPPAGPPGRQFHRLLPQSLHCEIPAERVEQVHATARILGDEVWRRFPWSCGADGGFVLPMTTEPEQALLNRTWRPTLSVTGAEGLPPLSSAGNVLRPRTAFAVAAPAAAGRRRGRLAGDQGAAGSRRAVQRQGHLQGQRRRRHRLERAGLGALADPGAGRRLAGLLRFALRLHWPGRHHPADEHPAKGFPRRSSWSAACWARSPTPTAPTSSCTFPTARSSPPPWPKPWPRCRPPDPPSARPCRRACGLSARAFFSGIPSMITTSDAYASVLEETQHWLNRRHRPEPLSFAKAVRSRTRSATPSATPPTPRAC